MIGAAAGPRPTTPTIPHIFFSDSPTIRRVKHKRALHWNLIMDRSYNRRKETNNALVIARNETPGVR